MSRYIISGYDKDHDIFADYEGFDDYNKAKEIFEFYKMWFHENILKSELGELVDFVAIYDTKTNERLDIESWC